MVLLTGISAIVISLIAAYFSVTGIGLLFAGAFLSVTIMAASLELSKLIAAAYLKIYWNSINFMIKCYMLIGVLILMVITSVGIFGYLSSAYEKVAKQDSISEKQITQINFQKKGYESQLKLNTERINVLVQLRINQENRLTSLYDKNQNKGAKNTETSIKDANLQIDKLSINNEIVNKKILSCDSNIAVLSTTDVAAKVGPLKYIARIFNSDMDTVVKWFILLIMLVFDPLAITLLIAYNNALDIEKNNTSEISIKPITPANNWFTNIKNNIHNYRKQKNTDMKIDTNIESKDELEPIVNEISNISEVEKTDEINNVVETNQIEENVISNIENKLESNIVEDKQPTKWPFSYISKD